MTAKDRRTSKFAYSPDRSMLGAVWVDPGEELTGALHETFLWSRIDELMQRVHGRESLKASMGLHLSEAGLDLDADEALVDAGALIQAVSPGLRVQGAFVSASCKVVEDDQEAREHLLSELDEPEQALLSWLGNALSPLDTSRDESSCELHRVDRPLAAEAPYMTREAFDALIDEVLQERQGPRPPTRGNS